MFCRYACAHLHVAELKAKADFMRDIRVELLTLMAQTHTALLDELLTLLETHMGMAAVERPVPYWRLPPPPHLRKCG